MSALTRHRRRQRRAGNHRRQEAIRTFNAAVWLGRRLWRPVAADLLSHRPAPRGHRHVARAPWAKRSARTRSHGVRGKLAALR